MAFPAVTNVTGSNPGPQADALPDTIQLPTGNIWKLGVFSVSLSPTTLAVSTSSEVTFAAVGIGLLTTDFVWVNCTSNINGSGVVNARVISTDTLGLTFVNPMSSGISPATATFNVMVLRIQPNWSKPSSGNQIDW